VRQAEEEKNEVSMHFNRQLGELSATVKEVVRENQDLKEEA
jgi:hypothetical protein